MIWIFRTCGPSKTVPLAMIRMKKLNGMLTLTFSVVFYRTNYLLDRLFSSTKMCFSLSFILRVPRLPSVASDLFSILFLHLNTIYDYRLCGIFWCSQPSKIVISNFKLLLRKNERIEAD